MGQHSTMVSQLPAWPPADLLDGARLEALSSDARDYALTHGLVYRALPAAQGQAPPPDTAIHAPLTLLPSPHPRVLYEHAQKLQPLFNQLYAKVALDDAFLEQVIGGAVAKVDDFQRRLYEIWLRVREEGVVQNAHLGLFRSDYLMHAEEASGELELKQVEINTISSSFGPLCVQASGMHRYLLAKGAYEGADPLLAAANMPENSALATLTSGLAAAHAHYMEKTRAQRPAQTHPVVLFVTQPEERNSFDQRALEYALLEQHGIRTVSMNLEQLGQTASLHGPERVLSVLSPVSHMPMEVSTVYFRAGYGPGDYTSEAPWDTRLLLERSLAVKCPTVALQLAGAKKVQQVLTEPGVLERYIGRSADIVRTTFTQLYPLDEHSPLGREAFRLAHENPEAYVLKPQREGGSNNIYKGDIPPALDAMERRDQERRERDEQVAVKEREGYILMSLIRTPPERGSILLRAAGPNGERPQAVHVPSTVSELGVYGAVLFSPDQSGGAHFHADTSGGHLVRTKSSESNEGGVAVGFSVIDTPLLV